jgi:hypothetical protein
MMSLYETDFHAWAREQAALLRSGRLETADLDHIAEEIESMGRSEQRTLESRLAVLMLHLLKWRYQPALRGRSWDLSIMEQRRRLERHLRQNPSLKARLDESMADAYGDAVIAAARETGLEPEAFPDGCPWTFEQMMDPAFRPEASG